MTLRERRGRKKAFNRAGTSSCPNPLLVGRNIAPVWRMLLVLAFRMHAHPSLERTYFYERLRAVSSGILESASSTFLLLIAVRQYHSGAIGKAVLAGSSSAGLLVSPGMVWITARLGWTTSRAAARILAVGAVGMGLAALFPIEPIFVIGASLGLLSTSACVPLVTQIYQDNYPAESRGRFFSRTFMIRIAAAAIMSGIGGSGLGARMDLFPWLLGLFAVSLAFGSECLRRCPSKPLLADTGAHPLRGWRYVREDSVLRNTLISWMLMGFANLMMLPLRVEYLANPRFGLSLSPFIIAVLTGVIPHTARFLMSPVWGHWFDRMNFFGLRLTLNVGFALGILCFFTSNSALGLILAAVIYGISNAGGDVAWSLWVTRFAPGERVAEYMAVHTFLTGIRGVLAPIAAFFLIQRFPASQMALGCGLLIGLACAVLIPEWLGKKPFRHAAERSAGTRT